MVNFDERYAELVDCLSRNKHAREIEQRMDDWCDRNLEYFATNEELENATIDYLESLCLEYGAY